MASRRFSQSRIPDFFSFLPPGGFFQAAEFGAALAVALLTETLVYFSGPGQTFPGGQRVVGFVKFSDTETGHPVILGTGLLKLRKPGFDIGYLPAGLPGRIAEFRGIMQMAGLIHIGQAFPIILCYFLSVNGADIRDLMLVAAILNGFDPFFPRGSALSGFFSGQGPVDTGSRRFVAAVPQTAPGGKFIGFLIIVRNGKKGPPPGRRIAAASESRP